MMPGGPSIFGTYAPAGALAVGASRQTGQTPAYVLHQESASDFPVEVLAALVGLTQDCLGDSLSLYYRAGETLDSILTRIAAEVCRLLPDDCWTVPVWSGSQTRPRHMILAVRDGQPALAVLAVPVDVCSESVLEPFRGPGEIEVSAIGLAGQVRSLIPALRAAFTEARSPAVFWKYSAEHGIDQRSFYLTDRPQILPCCYPWLLPDGHEAFYQAYQESPASILLLIGPPGTGKTTFLRGLLHAGMLNATVTHDDSLLESDQIFVDFLQSRDSDILIAEDADLMLASRESGGNKTMARLLAISDGLVQMPRKKMVFSTNLDTVSAVDPALLRPGRCFAVVRFRKLDKAEVSAVCQGYALKDPGRAATLAELFRQADPAGHGPGLVRKVGF